MFATHYHELAALEGELPGVRNYNISAKKQNGKLIFLRKILPGATDESYGIEVAKLAGVPEFVVRKANEHLRTLESQLPVAPTVREDEGQLSLEAVGSHSVLRKLRNLDPNSMTPMEALQLLYELKREAAGE
jgi:DNA mismatch repair protein MutS